MNIYSHKIFIYIILPYYSVLNFYLRRYILCLKIKGTTMEGLSLLLDNVASLNSHFGFHPKCSLIKLNHLCFADDLLIFLLLLLILLMLSMISFLNLKLSLRVEGKSF